jgi:hypothetical protein
MKVSVAIARLVVAALTESWRGGAGHLLHRMLAVL